MTSRKSSSLLPAASDAWLDRPVMLPPRARQARDNSTGNRIARGREHDRYCRSCLLRGENGRGVVSENDINLEADELRCNLSKPFASSLSPPILNGDIAPFGPAQFIQPPDEGGSPLSLGRSRTRAKNANIRQLAHLLRPRRERPRANASNKPDELPPPHAVSPQSVGRTLTLHSTTRTVLGANLNRSEFQGLVDLPQTSSDL